MHILRRRLLRRFVLDTLESRKIRSISQDMAAADAHGVCTGTHAFIAVGECATFVAHHIRCHKGGCVHIGVGLCVVVLLVWAMRGPQCVEQQRAGFHAFFVCARNYVV